MNMHEHRVLYSFVSGERLKVDGSNFVEWYLRLRTVLKRANVLSMIDEHVGDPPGNNMDEQIMLDYHARQRTYSIVKSVLEVCMSQELRDQFEETNASDMIDMLQRLCISSEWPDLS